MFATNKPPSMPPPTAVAWHQHNPQPCLRKFLLGQIVMRKPRTTLLCMFTVQVIPVPRRAPCSKLIGLLN